jgi:hypothetical protein
MIAKRFISLIILAGFGFCAVILLFVILSSRNPSPNTLSESTPALSQEKLWSLIQNWRRENNLKPYIKDENLCKFAEGRLLEVADDWSHEGYREKARTMLNGYSMTAENLVKDFNSEYSALNAWLNSPSHLGSLKREYTYSCVRCNNNICVQIFGNTNNAQVNGITSLKTADDPIMQCNYRYLGTQSIPKSLCDKQFECQVGDKWYFYTDKDKCRHDQDVNLKVQRYYNQENYVIPTINNEPYPTWKPQERYVLPTFEPLPTLQVNKLNGDITFNDNPPAPTAPVGYGYSN